ncbi:MAG TPA: HEAT repeat domain-containing protein [Rudaea sp.]|nr:HEAT repeat domain-containing protein [Rudaea sp.]
MNIFHRTLSPLALLVIAGSASASEADLAKRIAQQDGWIAYQVPMIADAGVPCCFEWHDKRAHRGECDLEGRNWNIGTNDGERAQAVSDTLDVYLRVAHGRIEKVRAFAATCPVRDADKVHWLDGVEARPSIVLLGGVAAATTSQDIADNAIAAVALHADVAATPALGELAGSSHPRKVREQALFWLGQLRGADGAHIVEHVATTDGDAELRAEAVFALSQAHAVDAYAAIHRIAQSDPSEHVRGQALFWMAQTGDARAKDDITVAIGKETSKDVREQAVFALSQLKDHEADAALIALVRGNYPREVKKQALFWLGQSGSNEAMKFLDGVLSRGAEKAIDG